MPSQTKKPTVSWAASKDVWPEVILHLCNALVRPHLQYCIQYRRDMELLERVQRKVTKRIQGMEHFPIEDRLIDMGLFSLNNRFQGDLREAFQYLKSGYKKGQTL